jgi:large subunit ribosomal protein L25
MSTTNELVAEARDDKGTGASRRLRRAGKIPAVIYGGGKEPAMVMFDHDPILHKLEVESFHTSILNVKHHNETEQAILRDVQHHPYKPIIIHMDLQRINAKEKIHMSVPIHFVGEEVAPGVKQDSGIISHLITEVDVLCLPGDLPEYLTAELSELKMGESVHLSDIKLPDGVELTSMAHGGDDLAVATVVAPRAAVADIEADEADAAAAAAASEASAEAGEAAEEKKEPKKEDE